MTYSLKMVMTIVAVSAAVNGASILVSSSEVQDFVGSSQAKLCWYGSGGVNYVDFSQSSPSIHTVPGSSNQDYVAPHISPDGERIAYYDNGDTKIYRFSDGATSTISNHSSIYWITDTRVFLAPNFKGESPRFDGSSILDLQSDGMTPDGDLQQVETPGASTSAWDAGITRDEVWVGESYARSHVYNMNTGEEYSEMWHQDGGSWVNHYEIESHCYGSIGLMPDGRPCMLFNEHNPIALYTLNTSNDRFELYDSWSFSNPGGEYHAPDMSNNNNFFTFTAGGGNNTYVLVRISDGAHMSLVNNAAWRRSSMWIPETPTGPSISQHPQDVTVDDGQSATFTVSASGQGSLSYEWYRDGQVVGSNSDTYTIDATTGTMSGNTIYVKVTDDNGTVTSQSATLTVNVVDDTPPTAPSNLQSSSVTMTGLSLSWDAAEDAQSGIARYYVYRDGSLIDSTTATSWTDNGLSENTTYTYEVSALNNGGVEGDKSSALDVTTEADTQAPGLVSVTVKNATEVEVEFSEPVNQSDAQDAANYTIDGGISVSAASLGSGDSTVSLTVSSLTAGSSYTLTVSSIRDQASSANTATNLTKNFTFVAELQITNMSPSGYEVDELQNNKNIYTDRSYKYSDVGSYAGMTYIRTANNDANQTTADFLTFDVNQGVTVYVGYDQRASSVPDWMSSWTGTGDQLTVTDDHMSHFNVYSQDFSAGTVTLGGNMATGAQGAQGMYGVIVEPTGSSAPVDTITIMSPQQGEVYHVGDTLTIRWDTDHSIVEDVQINLYFMNKLYYAQDIAGGSIAIGDTNALGDTIWGEYKYVIPPKERAGSDSVSTVSDACHIQIHRYGDRDISAFSGQFAIQSEATVAEGSEGVLAAQGIRITTGAHGAITAAVRVPGAHSLALYTVDGKRVRMLRGMNPASYTLGKGLAHGLYLLKIEAGAHEVTRPVLLHR